MLILSLAVSIQKSRDGSKPKIHTFLMGFANVDLTLIGSAAYQDLNGATPREEVLVIRSFR